MTHSKTAIRAMVLMAAVSTWARGEALTTAGRVDTVTVYRGQALVSRVVDLKGPAGLREIVVTDLPARVQAGSVFAEGTDDIEVRSVLFRERAVADDVREEVRKLQETLETLAFAKADAERVTATVASHKAYLDKLENFTAATAAAEMKSGVLDPEKIAKISDFLLAERQKLAAKETELQKTQASLARDTSLAQRQLEELTRTSSKSVREAVIFVNVPKPDAQLRVRYLVDSATWQPSYTVRAEAAGKPASLSYNAAIQQTSGEDWSDVEMILSTATPALVARGPALDALRVTLAALQAAPGAPLAAIRELRQQQQSYEQVRNRGNFVNTASGRSAASPINAQVEADMNKVAGQLQVLELADTATRSDAERVADKAERRVSEETISVTYKMPNRSTLPSRADQQLVTLATHSLKADYYKVASPVLTRAVYNEASLVNDTGIVLLAGPVQSYMAGEFVGGGEIPTVSSGESFVVGFGIDPALRATRELVDKSDTVQGGNKITRFDYALSIENFGARPAVVRVLDRLPVSSGPEVRATLLNPAPAPVAVSEVALKKTGLLRWDVEVAANATGDKAAKVAYTLQLEHDRTMAVTSAGER